MREERSVFSQCQTHLLISQRLLCLWATTLHRSLVCPSKRRNRATVENKVLHRKGAPKMFRSFWQKAVVLRQCREDRRKWSSKWGWNGEKNSVGELFRYSWLQWVFKVSMVHWDPQLWSNKSWFYEPGLEKKHSFHSRVIFNILLVKIAFSPQYKNTEFT